MNISWTKLAVAWFLVILVGMVIVVPDAQDWRGYLAAFLWGWVGIGYPLEAGWLNKREVPQRADIPV